MILFKTTFHLDPEIEVEALAFIQNEYIKRSTEDGTLYKPQLFQMLVQYDEVGSSYVLQLRAKSKEDLDNWLLNGEGGALQEDILQKFGNNMSCFTALMKVVNV